MEEQRDAGAPSIEVRKREHMELALGAGSEGPLSPGWDDVHLIHNCLPEISLSDVDLATPFLGRQLRAPLWITGMTGGHERAAVVNRRLAAAAERHGIAMGVGSQRASLSDRTLRASYSVAREAAPTAFLIANIGAPQLVPQEGHAPIASDGLDLLVSDIKADAVAIHLNWLQEMVQPEGDRNAAGCLAAIEAAVRRFSVPVMVKETGAGIAREQARALAGAGIRAIDVGGAGGTSMVRIERARSSGNGGSIAASCFDTWGIPTAASVLEAQGCGVPVIATGGVRNGRDAARAVALGAHMVGVGRPFLVAAEQGADELDAAIEEFLHELRVTLFLSGCRYPREMRGRRPVLMGALAVWATQRGLW